MCQKRKVLVVDDDSDIREVVAAELSDLYEVVAVDNATDALRLMKSGAFNIVISDFHMHGMLGTEFLRTVLELYPEVVRILITGTELDKIQPPPPPNTTVIPKPFMIEVLLSAIKRQIDKQPKGDALAHLFAH